MCDATFFLPLDGSLLISLVPLPLSLFLSAHARIERGNRTSGSGGWSDRRARSHLWPLYRLAVLGRARRPELKEWNRSRNMVNDDCHNIQNLEYRCRSTSYGNLVRVCGCSRLHICVLSHIGKLCHLVLRELETPPKIKEANMTLTVQKVGPFNQLTCVGSWLCYSWFPKEFFHHNTLV